jgi:hypothetical protein
MTTPPVLQQLQSQSASERKAALVELQSQRTAVIRELMRLVGNERNAKAGIPGTPLHLAIIGLGEWNATGARSLLLEMIDYRLKVDAGAKYPPGYEYPAAFALTMMSARDIAADVSTRLSEEASPLRRRLMVWTLYRMLGAGGASEVLESASKRASGPQLERLKQAQEDLRFGNQLITRLQPPVR